MNKRYALVTGASSGIGLAVSRALVDDGYKAAGVARDFANVDFEELQKIQLDLSLIDSSIRSAPTIFTGP